MHYSRQRRRGRDLRSRSGESGGWAGDVVRTRGPGDGVQGRLGRTHSAVSPCAGSTRGTIFVCESVLEVRETSRRTEAQF